MDMNAAPASPLPLVQPTRGAKSLKHKSKRAAKGSSNSSSTSGASFGSNSSGNPDDAMRELLAGKIAELQIGTEPLDAPIDLSGVFQDEQLVARTRDAATRVLEDAELSAERKAEVLAAQVQAASDALEQMQQKIGELHAKCVLLRQRKNAATTELAKTAASKAKVEQLCRELQKQNKQALNENRRVTEEAELKRRELLTEFQTTIESVSAKMERKGEEHIATLREKESLQQKLMSFLDQYTLREEHFGKQLEAKDLTIQLAEAKLQHQTELTAREAERVKFALEKAKEFCEREMQLQAELNAYAEKFDVVQETLSQTNGLFATFREEMDKARTMTKYTKKLEKEKAALQKKCEAYDVGAIATVQEKMRASEEAQKQLEKIRKLESLCRQLQAERNSIRDSKQQLLPESA